MGEGWGDAYDGDLTFRAGVPGDFAAFYDGCFYGDRDDADRRAMVAREWDIFLDNPATLTMLVEDPGRPEGRRIVGCAQAVFVTDRFVAWARSGADPCVAWQAACPFPDGDWPLLGIEAVGRANAGAGLNALVPRWAVATELLGEAQILRLREAMGRRFALFSRGYNFREVLMPCFGADNLARAERAGFLRRCDYADYYREHPLAGAHPFLVGLTRPEALAAEGSLASHLFVFTPPRLGLSAREQQVLTRALADETTAQIAAGLGLSVSAVKNRWEDIYARVWERHPDLFEPLGGELGRGGPGGRGPEKQGLVVSYVREHPEELRPYLP